MDILAFRERLKWFPLTILKKMEETVHRENAVIQLHHNLVMPFGTAEFVLLFRKWSLPFYAATVFLCYVSFSGCADFCQPIFSTCEGKIIHIVHHIS